MTLHKLGLSARSDFLRVRDVFDQIDVDHSGLIDSDELVGMPRAHLYQCMHVNSSVLDVGLRTRDSHLEGLTSCITQALQKRWRNSDLGSPPPPSFSFSPSKTSWALAQGIDLRHLASPCVTLQAITLRHLASSWYPGFDERRDALQALWRAYSSSG